ITASALFFLGPRITDKVDVMTHKLLAMLATVAFLCLPGCCGTPLVCMPVCCHNPYWMEDLQDGYCQAAGNVNAHLCQASQRVRCSLSQWNAGMECACRKQQQARISHQSSTVAAPKLAPDFQIAATDVCDAPDSKCQERCSSCKQQPCRCGKCSGFERVENSSRPSIFSPALPSTNQNGMIQGNLAPNYSPSPTITPNSEPSQVRGVPPPPGSPAPSSKPPAPRRQGQPTPIPVPKITPNPATTPSPPSPNSPQPNTPAPDTSSTEPPPAETPSVDPSIPLERPPSLDQIGFRKADSEKPLYNGWKPVDQLPKALR
ncbi:MAG: hypothetical protein JWM11_1832, partial [Planctomycetaceae bacterium]|nr:hypothetical protein [Planctomycetaceae bacterium]